MDIWSQVLEVVEAGIVFTKKNGRTRTSSGTWQVKQKGETITFTCLCEHAMLCSVEDYLWWVYHAEDERRLA